MQKLDYLKESPSQTAGPYVHIGLTPNKLGNAGIYPVDLGESPIRDGARGQPITITGTVRDGAGMILRDALIESWQADADGIFPGNDPRGAADPNVTGWARIIADAGASDVPLDKKRMEIAQQQISEDFFTPPLFADWISFTNLWYPQLQSIILGDVSVEDGLNDAVDQTQTMMEDAGYYQ